MTTTPLLQDPSQLPAAQRAQHTFFLNAQGQSAPFWESATTLNFGGLYVEPVTQMFANSTRYGQAEDLFGLEALYPITAQGDTVGFQLTGDAFKSQAAVLLITTGLLAKPVPTPIGTMFLLPPTGTIALPFGLDAQGVAKSPTVAVPAGIKLWSQTAFLNLLTMTIRLSDATGVDVR